MTRNRPQRMWVNQPSTLQPLHHLHGVNVLAVEENDSCMEIYFLKGPVVSQVAPKEALSPGWLGISLTETPIARPKQA